ncbi:MAG TPA: hypothetical protein VLM38_07540 [Blastocatellia bacterium]|nr:hypothetical protein [Blastocatellia bacterium]
MKRTGLIVLLAVAFLAPSRINAVAGQNRNDWASTDESAYASIAPPFLTPAKASFSTREGDSFVVIVTATCLLQDDSDTQFELLSSSPRFVHVSSAYRNVNTQNEYAEGLGVVEISPQAGDAGKYIVSIRVKSCSGKVERVVTFKVRVKPALP